MGRATTRVVERLVTMVAIVGPVGMALIGSGIGVSNCSRRRVNSTTQLRKGKVKVRQALHHCPPPSMPWRSVAMQTAAWP